MGATNPKFERYDLINSFFFYWLVLAKTVPTNVDDEHCVSM
jgi:hypothetical protein